MNEILAHRVRAQIAMKYQLNEAAAESLEALCAALRDAGAEEAVRIALCDGYFVFKEVLDGLSDRELLQQLAARFERTVESWEELLAIALLGDATRESSV